MSGTTLQSKLLWAVHAHSLGTRLPTSPERCDVVASPPAPPPAAPASSPLTSILVQATQTPPEVPLLPDTLPSSFVRKPAKPGAQRRVMRANQLPAGLMAPPTNNTGASITSFFSQGGRDDTRGIMCVYNPGMHN